MKQPVLITLFFVLSLSLSAQPIISSKKSELKGKIELKIKTDHFIYREGETIWIEYELKNISDTVQQILIKENWSHLMGMGASIVSNKGTSICKHPTRSVYSSQIFTEDQLKMDYKKIPVNLAITGKVVLQKVPVFNDDIKNNIIPSGRYTVSLSYFSLMSNILEIEIK